MRLFRRLKYWLNARQNRADLAEEMDLHCELAGDGPAMGNLTRAREDTRAVWIWPWLESVMQDGRYALRNLRHQPGFAIVAILALGCAIGLNTSYFTVFDAIALRPWPVSDPNRMVKIFSLQPRPELDPGFSIPEFRYFAEHARSFTGILAMQRSWVRFGFEPFGKSSSGIFVDADHFRVLGVPMHLGRGFLPEENRIDSPQPVVVLSYTLWREHFSSDPEIVGKSVRVQDVPFVVVGVAPEEFLGTSRDREDAWFPFAALPSLYANDAWARRQIIEPGVPAWMLSGRLAPGVSRLQAKAEIETLDRQWRAQFGAPVARIDFTDATMAAGPAHGSNLLPGFALMFSGVTLVVLLACANVGNLLIARAAARRHEIEIRSSLGAARGRIVRQLLTESFLLALGSAGLGVLLSYELPRLVITRLGEAPPVLLQPDSQVLGYALALAVISCFVFGLAPALQGTRPKSGVARLPLRSFLLAAQIAISAVLLIGATLLLESVQRVRTHDPGFSSSDVSVVALDLPAFSYDRKRVMAFSRQLSKELDSRPELRPYALVEQEPLNNSGAGTVIRLPGEEPSADRSVLVRVVSPGYFDLLRIPIVAGRNFESSEDATRHVILINQTLARRYWGDENPVGKAFLSGTTPLEIVGVVRDSYSVSLDRIDPVVYQPFGGRPFAPKVLVRSTTPGATEAVAAIARQIDGRIRTQATPLSDYIDRWASASRFGAQLAGLLGMFALVLATIGMSGVCGYIVQQRTKEIGIRMALGARPRQVIALVLSGTSRAVLAGLATGLFGAIAIARLLTDFLYGVSPFDPRAYAAVALVLAAASLAAAFLPARRATKIDPMTALRCE